MEQVTIEKYQVSIRESAVGPRRVVRPALLLNGLDGRERTRVWIYFESPNRDMVNGSYLGLRKPVRNGGRELSLVMEPDAFESVYDLVRNESPVFFLYEYKDAPRNPSSETKLITLAQIGTLDEPTGEGPDDESS